MTPRPATRNRVDLGHADRALIEAVRQALAAAADPERAPKMQAYMKSPMPFLGVPAPVAQRAVRALARAHPSAGAEAWRDTILALFREATHREEWYAALTLAGIARYRRYLTPEALPLFEEIVVTGAWWDIVDEASHRIGDILEDHRTEATPLIRSWIRDPILWKRRASIICQLGHRDATDLGLLREAIEANLDDRDFFIRKAIGWALREYAKHDMRWVVAYVERLGPRLSPLSRREALKHAPIA